MKDKAITNKKSKKIITRHVSCVIQEHLLSNYSLLIVKVIISSLTSFIVHICVSKTLHYKFNLMVSKQKFGVTLFRIWRGNGYNLLLFILT